MDHLAHRGIVLDQHHAQPGWNRRVDDVAGGIRHVRGGRFRQVERDGGAGADRAGHRDRAARLLDEAVHGAEPEPGAAALRLGGEEGLEGALAHRVRHAAAGVDDVDRGTGVARSAQVLQLALHAVRQRGAAAAAKAQRAAVRHRVAGVDRDVQQRRLELHRVGQRVRAIGVDVDLDADALVDGAVQHAGQRVDVGGQVDRGGLQQLPAREREQLAGQFGAAAGRSRCGRDELARMHVTADGRQVLQDLQVALDHREQVVEVVGDAAGELADALQPLRMPQRLLGLRALQAGGE